MTRWGVLSPAIALEGRNSIDGNTTCSQCEVTSLAMLAGLESRFLETFTGVRENEVLVDRARRQFNPVSKG